MQIVNITYYSIDNYMMYSGNLNMKSTIRSIKFLESPVYLIHGLIPGLCSLERKISITRIVHFYVYPIQIQGQRAEVSISLVSSVRDHPFSNLTKMFKGVKGTE